MRCPTAGEHTENKPCLFSCFDELDLDLAGHARWRRSRDASLTHVSAKSGLARFGGTFSATSGAALPERHGLKTRFRVNESNAINELRRPVEGWPYNCQIIYLKSLP